MVPCNSMVRSKREYDTTVGKIPHQLACRHGVVLKWVPHCAAIYTGAKLFVWCIYGAGVECTRFTRNFTQRFERIRRDYGHVYHCGLSSAPTRCPIISRYYMYQLCSTYTTVAPLGGPMPFLLHRTRGVPNTLACSPCAG